MKHITKEQRYQIEAYLKVKKSIKFISEALNLHISTVYREVKRNSTKRGKYNAAHAHAMAMEKKERFKRERRFTDEVKTFIDDKIVNEQWSPEQISGYCKENNKPMVSPERIYQYIREDKLLGGSLYKHLRHRLKHRKRPVGGGKHSPIKDKVSIDERSEVIDNKERFGDWEIDTIIGKDGKGAIVTIVERKVGFILMRKLPKGKNAKELAKVVISMLLPYKKYVYSITSDNGTEFAEHKMMSEKLDTQFFFAHPYSSWERGLSEYSNKLIRQYIPKKSIFENFTDTQILDIQHKLNRRPRKKLNFNLPKNIFYNLTK